MKSRGVACGLCLAALVGLADFGCAGVGSWRGPPACAPRPLSGAELAADQRLHTRMRIRAREETAQLEVVAVGEPDGVLVVGLASYGVRLFAARQRGAVVSVESAVSPELEALARFALDALQRIYWTPAPASAGGEARAEWWHGDEVVAQWREAGALQREFVRADAPDSERIRIEYPPPEGDAQSVRIRNPVCGYEAVVVAVDGGGARAPARGSRAPKAPDRASQEDAG